MKQKIVWLLSATLLFSMAGCSSSKKASNQQTQAPAVTEAGTVVKTEYGDVTLGKYKGLSAQKNIYNVTDEEIQEEVENLMLEYAEYNEVNRASKSGDYIMANFVAEENGEVLLDCSEEEAEIALGEQLYGEEFDKNLTGVSAGDQRTFTVTYAEDYEDVQWAGKTVKFAVTVNSIVEEKVPECTEEFVSKNLDYESIADMKKQLKDALESDKASQSDYELRENLLQQVIDASAFTGYSDELYESYKSTVEESYLSYATMFGYETSEEFCEAMNITDKDLEKEAKGLLYRKLVISAISSQENLSLSDDEYEEGLAQYAQEYEYDSTEEFLEEYDEGSVRTAILEEKVLDLLQQNATITEVQATEDPNN